MGFSLIKQTFAKLLPRPGTWLGTGKNVLTAYVESRWLNWQLRLNQHCTETQTGLQTQKLTLPGTIRKGFSEEVPFMLKLLEE